MKRIILTAALAAGLLVAGPALADPDIGCGPGTQVWKGQSGIAPKVLGATTNGSFGLQTFGITFGTLGCNQGGTVTAQERARVFADANLDRLARDVARGDGETLRALAHLMGVPEAEQAAFRSAAKQRFAEIFSGPDVTSVEVLAQLREILADDATPAARTAG